jgi:nitrite reductase [NAD(P)H] small subunit
MTSEHTWTRITQAGSIPPRQGRAVRVGGMELAIFNLNDRFLTIENECPHKGGPLCDGIVSGTTVVCPLHGWHFDLESGMGVRASLPLCVATFPTRVEDGFILVDIGAGMRIEMEAVSNER